MAALRGAKAAARLHSSKIQSSGMVCCMVFSDLGHGQRFVLVNFVIDGGSSAAALSSRPCCPAWCW